MNVRFVRKYAIGIIILNFTNLNIKVVSQKCQHIFNNTFNISIRILKTLKSGESFVGEL